MVTEIMISEICNFITIAETAQKLGKGFFNWRYYYNKLRSPLKIAVLGESGSGKSCFLNSFGGKEYSEGSTRFIETFYILYLTDKDLSFMIVQGRPHIEPHDKR